MKYLFTLLSSLLCATLAMSQPGSLDKSFGDTGVFISRTFEGDGRDVLVQKDGKIISIGTDQTVGGFLVVRYNIDGSPDLSFGDSSRVVTLVSPDGSSGFYGALQEDGKIVVAGRFGIRGDFKNHVAVVRYLPDGTPDSSFGVNGVAKENLGEGVSKNPFGIAIQPDGKIVVGGSTTDQVFGQESPTFFILRYNPDGSPDLSFGDKGGYQEEVDDLIGNNGGFAMQPDGKMLLGATRYSITGTPFFVRRYTTNGTVDSAFGTNGEARFTFPLSTGGGDMYAIVLREDGRIVCGGNSALVQFNGDGSVDGGFGEGGFVFIFTTPYRTNIREIALQPDGKVLAGGYKTIDNDNNTAFALFRYEVDGGVDSSFGEDGVALTAAGKYPVANAIALQKDGRIILSGYSVTLPLYTPHVTLARYNGDESRRQIVVGRIKRWLQHHGITWQGDDGVIYYTVQRSMDGGITYQPVARINNNHQPQYNYEDAMVTDHSLYRIAATGRDGSRIYSNSVAIDNEGSVKVFPNPVRSNLQVQGLPSAGKTNISISDFNGNVRTSAVTSGSQYSISTANLKPGNYLLKVQHDNTVTTQTFVKE